MMNGPGTILRKVAGAAALAYGGFAGYQWLRYGHADLTAAPDPLFDSFMPDCEVRERHETRVSAPAGVTLAAAKRIRIADSPLVDGIFALRELPSRLLGTAPPRDPRPLVEVVAAIGWVVLAEVPDREIIFGSVSQPWKADVVFRGVPPPEFAGFSEPGYVKIAWNLRAEPLDDDTSVFITETRVATTDAVSRARFRRYWAALSPGIIAIRYEMLRLTRLRAEASLAPA